MKNTKYKIEENSVTRFIFRIAGIFLVSYLVTNFNENPEIFGIVILIIALYLLVMDESYKIKTDGVRIKISHSNLLKIFASHQTIRFIDIERFEFIPSEFSATLFILNFFVRSGTNSHKKSRLIIYKKNGEIVKLNNLGSEDDINHLQQWL